MSFITKRERIFNEYDTFELPNRNEGKLKAYSSCTDARAWSHFGSDKTEHLVDVIKKNNCVCRPKYFPTETIVDTLMVSKNARIYALQRKIDEFEEMMAAYDELDLTCDQKCEIAKAHASIREANRDLNGLFLNLDMDMSQFTEGSEAYETGKSRGDEGDRPDDLTATSRLEEKEYLDACLQTRPTPHNTTGTMATDPRIQEMQDTIIAKDAKMSAMQNTMAVMENDVCEPYCLYAHIYTALEKIFGILCQNEKYKAYLNAMITGKDTRSIDIKGKILYKLKILEKFSLALISPCSQESAKKNDGCSCYRAEFETRINTYALTSAESKQPLLDNKRAQLVADIMANDEMREILSKENATLKNDLEMEEYEIENYNIDTENLKRLKNLQLNYDELMTCYESLKHDKDCLQKRVYKYEEIQKEFEDLKCQLREYSMLWNEKEHYRKRSVDLDSLKEQYLVLSEETSNIEIQLKAEAEINNIKGRTIDELRQDNIILEKKINEASLIFEKEKNALQCKLKESECKTMCQDQQIRSLSTQIDRLLELEAHKGQKEYDNIALQDEINKLNEQITNLKAVCICNDEEKQQLQEEFQTNLINNLKMEIEELKSGCEQVVQRNDFLEKNAASYREEIERLDQDLKEKSKALENLMNILQRKSNEVNRLMKDMEKRNKENGELYSHVQNLQESYDKSLTSLDSEKQEVIKNLQLAKQESHELLKKVKSYDNIASKHDALENSYQAKSSEYNNLKCLLAETQSKNENLLKDLSNHVSNNSFLIQELEELRETSRITEEEKNKYKLSLELTDYESKVLNEKLDLFDNLSDELEKLKYSYSMLEKEKNQLETILQLKTRDLDDAFNSIEMSKQESEQLLDKLQNSENLKTDLKTLNEAYNIILQEKQGLQNDFDSLLESFNKQSLEVDTVHRELCAIKKAHDQLLADKNNLQSDLNNQTGVYNDLLNNLANKIKENEILMHRLSDYEDQNQTANNNINSLMKENTSAKSNLTELKRESAELLNKLKYYEALETAYNNLKRDHEHISQEKNNLQRELKRQISDLKNVERENLVLSSQSQELLSHSEVLEKALIDARTEILDKQSYTVFPRPDISKQIEEMKAEKLKQHKKISELLDKYEDSENDILNLHEIIKARNDKIVVLQNHINALQDEVRDLHKNLEAVVDTGEEIVDNSSRVNNESLRALNAHHSKASHNIKMDIAKLRSENSILEETVSETKIKCEEAMQRDRQKYLSQISNLLNDRKIIVTDIRQLEIRSVGDSVLSSDRCEIGDICNSLERIGKIMDLKSSNKNLLEQSLLSVQNSYQLVQAKTDEAIKIIEKEKQKITNEKEEAIKAKVYMEKQLQLLTEQIHKQKSRDEKIIKDLEAEILNQKLITDRGNEYTHSLITKLEEELKSFKALYKNSLQNIDELEKKLKKDQSHYFDVTQKMNKDLESKMQEVDQLNKMFNNLKNKPGENVGIQTTATSSNNVKNQPEEYKDGKTQSKGRFDDPFEEQNVSPMIKKRDKKLSSGKDKNEMMNEVKVVTAAIDQSFDFEKSSYLDNKLKQLVQGPLEICSISDTNFNSKTDDLPAVSYRPDSKSQSLKVIDIYNKQSVHTNSSKGLDNDFSENNETSNKSKKQNKPGVFTITNDSDNNSSAIVDKIKKKYKNKDMLGSTSDGSRDLFVIYKDSESNPNKSHEKKRPWNINANSEIIVESLTIEQNEIQDRLPTNNKAPKGQESTNNELYNDLEDEEYEEDDSVKHKLKINLPRVGTDSHSINGSDDDKKSAESLADFSKAYSSSTDYKEETHFESYGEKLKISSTHSIPRDRQYKNKIPKKRKDYNKYEQKKLNEQNYPERFTGSDSRHKLSRVEADVLLLKSEHEPNPNEKILEKNNQQKSLDHGLNYILDSHIYPDNINTYIAAKRLRKTRSVERVNLFSSSPETSMDVSPTRYELLKSFAENKPASVSSKTSPKSFTERSIMVKLVTVEEYEKKIQALTRTLENIEKDYKTKIDAIKMQYDSNIKSILNEHNQGVESIQSLHEETLQDILKIHENEVENLRTMSIDAMRKADKLEKENKTLKNKLVESCTCLDEEPTKMSTPEFKRKKHCRGGDPKNLTKTNIEAFNVKPNSKTHGPCTCSMDPNISDTIRNIFEQVDVDQRKVQEHTYLKHIANKILCGNVDALDTQELSFLHLKVCRIWKTKITKEESLQKRIDCLEAELMSKQKHTQQNIAELDRKVAEERRRLQEVREAVCRSSITAENVHQPHTTAERETCGGRFDAFEKRSISEIGQVSVGLRPKKTRNESNRAVLAKLDAEDRREKKIYTDEMPTRLRRSHDKDRFGLRTKK